MEIFPISDCLKPRFVKKYYLIATSDDVILGTFVDISVIFLA